MTVYVGGIVTVQVSLTQWRYIHHFSLIFLFGFLSLELIFKVPLNGAYPCGSYIPQSHLPSIFFYEVSFSTFNLSSCISFACKGDLIFISSDPLVTHVETYLTFVNIFILKAVLWMKGQHLYLCYRWFSFEISFSECNSVKKIFSGKLLYTATIVRWWMRGTKYHALTRYWMPLEFQQVIDLVLQ